MNETVTEVLDDTMDIEHVTKIYFIVKRIVDFFGGLVGCILLIPITIAVKIAYMITGDFDPIFFKQERIGKDGKPINIYKFRTMVMNADAVLKELLENDEKLAAEYKRYKKLENDPRVTKAGNFVRSFSIDEVPQFINVLKGEMSLVGPRPYLFREKKDMGDYYQTIIKCKPGVSGYWQVNGRSHTDFAYRMELDEYYFKRRNLILDLKILLKTMIKVFKKDGAK